jgi:hypothetical protein
MNEDLKIAYEATVQHWIHAEETRWSLLNNYFTGCSILLLTWAAVFTSHDVPYRRLISGLLAGTGLIISILWARLSHRANEFVYAYGELGVRLERGFGRDGPTQFPFHSSQLRRSQLGAKSGVSSSVTVVLVPSLFAVLYLFLVILAVRLRQ